MRLVGVPHTCSSRMLAGFDRFNGTGTSDVRVKFKIEQYINHYMDSDHSREIDFFYQLIRQYAEGQYSKDQVLSVLGNLNATYLVIAITTTSQVSGNRFLKGLGFKLSDESADKKIKLWSIHGRDLNKILVKLVKDYCVFSYSSVSKNICSKDMKIHFDLDGLDRYFLSTLDESEVQGLRRSTLIASSNLNTLLKPRPKNHKVVYYPPIVEGDLINPTFYAMEKLIIKNNKPK